MRWENNLNLDFNLTWSPFALLSFWHGDFSIVMLFR